MSTLRLLVQMALRNLFAARLKSLIVGGIIFGGAFGLVVVGSLVSSIGDGMSRSIIDGIAGHVQIYSAQSKDELALLGQMGMGDPDLKALDNFSRVRDAVETLPHVKAVVPMGTQGALITSGNTIDLALERLRDAVRKKLAGDRSPETRDAIEAHKAHVRQMVGILQEDFQSLHVIADERAVAAEDAAAVKKAGSPEFWDSFDRDPLNHLEFLENKIAPLATDADLIYIRYLGTDPAKFAQAFRGMEIVDGTTIPEGKRGFLIAKQVYEDQLKLKTARRLDQIKEAIEIGRRTIAKDEELKRFVKENTSQTREILLLLDPTKSKLAVERLQKDLGSSEADLEKLLPAFLATNDGNFMDRYAAFYRDVAPLVDLYRIRVGDKITIKAFTKTGYVESVSLPVYGTFQMKGLEKSALGGLMNLMDLVSFRELYGYLSADKAAEIADIKKDSAIQQVDRGNAEAELFGAPAPEHKSVVLHATPGLIDEKKELSGIAKTLRDRERADRAFSPEELESGVALSAAVMLDDPKNIPVAIREIEEAGKKAGLPLKAVSWQKATGLLGQMVMAMGMVLVVAAFIIFIVALVIINNAMVMATLERVQEIGTLRAIGAQKPFVLLTLGVEAIATGAVFGGLGVLAGTAVVRWIGAVGIPAFSDVMFFFFSGPRLHPTVAAGSIVVSFATVLVVASLSSFYPAWLAMKVPPVQAMMTEE